MVSARFRRLAVADVRRETADCVSIAFAVPPRAAPVFRFQPGQYLTLRARFGGKELRRCYSICDDRELRIAVKRVPGGVFSTWATEALAPVKPFSFFTYHHSVQIMRDGILWGDFLLLSAVTAVLVAVAIYFFQRRDLAV